MGAYARERAADRIADLAHRGLDATTFCREAQDAVHAAVPSSPITGWDTIDPATLLITSSRDHEGTDAPHEVLVWEYCVDDVMKSADIARSVRGIQTLAEATGGDPTGTPLYRQFLEPMGIADVVEVSLRSRAGEAWGSLALSRRPGRPPFEAAELDFLAAVAPDLARGVHRGLLIGEATHPEEVDAPGLVVLGTDWDVESLTPGVEGLLGDLPGRWEADGSLPPAVVAVAGRALRTAESAEGPGEVAVARVLSHSGRWVVLHGAALVAAGGRRAAVIIEPAHPARIAPLLMAAYGLTGREQDVTRLVLRGDATTDIAAALCVSPHTVQQHLKSVFDKTDVRSRRELVSKVFFSHYAPRVRDNGQRVAEGRAILGGPVALGMTPSRPRGQVAGVPQEIASVRQPAP